MRLIEHRVVIPWDTVDEDWGTLALKLLIKFRRRNLVYNGLSADVLTWWYLWTEPPLLLDMGMKADARAEARVKAVQDVFLVCGKGGFEERSRSLGSSAAEVLDAILDEEIARTSTVDWEYQGPQGVIVGETAPLRDQIEDESG